MDNKFYIKETAKYREYYNVTLQWVKLKQKNICLDEYISKRGFNKIAIYGMSDIGNCLYYELANSEKCELLYSVDQGEPKLYQDVLCYRLDDICKLEIPDIIIVTLPHISDEVTRNIRKYVDCEIVSITELIYDAYYDLD